MTHLKQANRLIKLWQDFGDDCYPVDLKKVVTEIVNKSSGTDRLHLVVKPLGEIDGAMVRSKEYPASYTAFVNAKVSNPRRRRFTLAHEIGHFVLHRTFQDEFHCTRAMIANFRLEGVEFEANQFASQLLIPPNRIREFEKKPWNIDTLREIADYFEVSLQAAGLRMARLSTRPIGFVVSVSDMVDWGCASKALYKRGCYFKSMMDVPEGSTAFGAERSEEKLDHRETHREMWGIEETFQEESTLGYDGKIYTCIDVA